MASLRGANVAPVNSCRALETCPCCTLFWAALPRRSFSCCSDKLCWTGRTGRSAQTLWINSDQEPLAKRSNLWANSLLPTEPVPLGLCKSIIGINPNNFHARVSDSASPINLAWNLSRNAKPKHSRSLPRRWWGQVRNIGTLIKKISSTLN